MRPYPKSRLPIHWGSLPWDIEKNRSLEKALSESIQILTREEIAVGGTSLIYRINYSNGSKEIEKTLLPKFQGKSDYEALHQKEAEILRNLEHPLIVKILRSRMEGCSLSASTTVNVMEYIEGVPLSKFSDFLFNLTPELRLIWANELLQQVASTLLHLRSKGVIHGDLAPDNILIQSNGFVKLIDFGVSRFEDDTTSFFRVEGRARFRAPELKDTGQTSREGDIYALGRIFEEVLGEELARDIENHKILNELVIDRKIPKIKWQPDGWFRGLSPLPNLIFFRQTGFVRQKTKLTPKNPLSPEVRAFLMIASLVCFLPFLSSWLPQEATISINSWPYSSFSIDKLGRDLRFETPIPKLKVPSGNIEVEFIVPSQNNRRVIRRLRVLPGDDVKLYEDFQNLDTLKP